MPIMNLTKGGRLAQKVTVADSLLARLTGLLGTVRPDSQTTLCLTPCAGVHTFGMKYPIDVVFLDAQGKVVKLFQNFPPNRMTKVIPSAKCALELPPGTITAQAIQTGDYLKVIPDARHQEGWAGFKKILHWPANIFMALLWGNFVLSSFLHWQQNGGILSSGLLLVNTLLAFLFLSRRESTDISHRVVDWIIPILTVGLSMALRPYGSGNSSVIALSMAMQIIGIIGMVNALVFLGRSFGIIPANRRIKYSGPYKIVRHPLYASEIVFYAGFLLGNFSAFNLFVVIGILAGQMWRAVSEEKLLSKEKRYVEYMKSVQYRFVPGIF